MKIIIQRVSSASITVDREVIASSQAAGLLALIGFGKNDTEDLLEQALNKIAALRIFSNDKGRFDLSLIDICGDLTLVPQFTLYADTSKGRRPEFFNALNPNDAAILFEKMVVLAQKSLVKNKVHSGSFGADMKVALTNDGPVTISIEVI